MRPALPAAVPVLILAATFAYAQPYRTVDGKGGVIFTDTPPKAARGAAPKPAAAPAAADAADNAQLPFEIQRKMKDFPVTLYTAPICKQPCEQARALLNRRGVPFTEVQVWNTETLEQLKARANSENVPAITVGRSALAGLDSVRYEALLDSAGYPPAGSVPARAQKAPPLPEGYEPPPVAEAVAPPADAPAVKAGPYDTSGLPSNRSGKPGPYDTSGLPSNQSGKPGRYGVPDAAK